MIFLDLTFCVVGSFVLLFRQPDRIPLDHIIHHGSQMDAQATSIAGAEHIINGMILVEIDLCENGFTITVELAVKFQRRAGKYPEGLDLVMILFNIRQVFG